PLSAAPSFQRSAKAVGDPPLAWMYVAVRRIVDFLAKAGSDRETQQGVAIANLLGVPSIEGLALGLSWQKGDGLATVYLDFPNGRQGLFAVPCETKLDPVLLDRVPANAFFAWACGWDLPGVWGRILGLTGAVPPLKEMLDQKIPEVEDAIGVKIAEDLLGTIGSQQVSWLAFPPDGGLVPDDLGAMKLSDPAGFMKAIGTATAHLGGAIRKVPAGSATMTVVEIPILEAATKIGRIFDESTPSVDEIVQNVGDNPIAAAVAANISTQIALVLEGDVLIAANSPLALKRYIATRAAGGWKTLGADAFFQKTTAGRLAGRNGFVYLRMDPALARLYGAAVPMLQVLAGGPLRRMVGADLAQLPTPEFIERIFSGALMTYRVDADGIEIKASSGGTALIALGGLAPLAVLAPRRAPAPPVWIEEPTAPPEEEVEEEVEEELPAEKEGEVMP
ncbi:MAG: hypothetical protein JXP34_21235, partial [Planctomycetes bacterium]|nr:hypothetical protein [Planctomycetota bacterium]